MHTISDKGEVLSWGHGGHGQLGHSSLHSRKGPEPVEALANEKVTYIACGGSSSAAVTGKKNQLICYICTNIFKVNMKQFSEMQNFLLVDSTNYKGITEKKGYLFDQTKGSYTCGAMLQTINLVFLDFQNFNRHQLRLNFSAMMMV